jgi:Tol biopolymer transport system component
VSARRARLLAASVAFLAFLGLGAPAGGAPKPEIIGPGVVSTAEDELGGTVSPDGETLYFERSIPPHYLYVLYESHRTRDGAWGPPEVLSFSGRYRDTDPVLSPDGQTMLFASDRPVGGVDRHHFYVWRVRRTAKGWSEPEMLPGPVNDGFNQVFCSIAANGNLYFTSSRKGGGYDIYRSRLVGGKYQSAEDLGPALNDPSIWTFESTIAPDESYMLIGSFGRQPSYGSSDLYISFNRNGLWGKPQNLGPAVNTPMRDYSPRISADRKWLYFTSERLEEPPALPLDLASFEKLVRGTYNTLGNLYRYPLEEILEAAKAEVPGP